MDTGSLERLVPILIFGAVVAFNYVGPWLRRWLKQQQKASAAAQKASGAATQPRSTRRTGARPARTTGATAGTATPSPVMASVVATASPSAPVRRRRVPYARALLSDRDRLRQSVVAAAVLGPCRADRPMDPGA